jgi:hypothetical protein
LRGEQERGVEQSHCGLQKEKKRTQKN